MKLLHTADWHLGKKIDDKYCLLNEQELVLGEIIEIAKQSCPDIIILAGDVFDKFRPSVEAQNLFYKTIKALNNYGRTPIFIVAGNHDSPDLIEVCRPLASSYGIFLLGWPDTITPIGKLPNGIEMLSSTAGFLELKLPNYEYPLKILFTPYINEERLKQRIDYIGPEDGINKDTLSDVLKKSWESLANKNFTGDSVNILIAHHFFINNKEQHIEDDGERSIKSLGSAQVINTSILPPQLQYVALGHLHSFIIMEKPPCPCPVVYSGSPLPYSFDEQNQNKYINIVEVEPNKKAKLTPVQLKVGQKLIRYKAKNIQDAKEWLTKNKNYFVELTIKVEEGIATNDKKALYALHPKIISIIPELTLEKDEKEQKQLPDLSNNIQTLFIEYFKNKNKGEIPSNELIETFNEVLAFQQQESE